MNIRPLGDRVLVEAMAKDDKGRTESGIIIPETVSKERGEQGKVIAVGPGKLNEAGELLPIAVKKGQTVLFSKYGPDEIKLEGKEYYIISESNILAVIE